MTQSCYKTVFITCNHAVIVWTLASFQQ